jgi:hypothetical protein
MWCAAVFVWSLAAQPAAGAEGREQMNGLSDSNAIVKESFHGWPNTYRLSNGMVEARVVTAVGPRIISFNRVGEENVLYTRAGELGGQGEADWTFRGGWRLWISPEVKETTYVPDNSPCEVEIVDDVLVVTGPLQPPAGIRKQIEVRLADGAPQLRIVARIKNISQRDLTYAAWSLPVLRPGGRALIPLDVGPLTAFDAFRRLIFWSYTEHDDPRYRFGDRLVQIDHAKVQPPLSPRAGRRDDESKIGVDSSQGWAAYVLEGTMFLKRFPHTQGATYPDGGSTIEVYSSSEFLELENLGPLTTIAPGEEIVLPEDWWLFEDVKIPEAEAEARRAIEPYLEQAKTTFPPTSSTVPRTGRHSPE